MEDLPVAPVLHVIAHRPWSDISGIHDWLSIHTARYLVGQHDPDDDVKRVHCHFMLVGIKTTEQSFRDLFRRQGVVGSGNICFMWKTQKSPRVEYDESKLGTYIAKGDRSIICSGSGYLEEHYMVFVRSWKGFVKRAISEPQSVESKLIIKIEKPEKRPDMWETIKCAWLDVPREKSLHMGPPQIRSFINAMYLRKGQPVPRMADCSRWAKSLWYLTKVNFKEEEITYEMVEKLSESASA